MPRCWPERSLRSLVACCWSPMNGRRSIVLFIACLSRLSSRLHLARRSSGLRSSAGLSDVVEAIDLGLRSYGEAFNISVISRQCTALCVLILSILPLSEYMWVTGSCQGEGTNRANACCAAVHARGAARG